MLHMYTYHIKLHKYTFKTYNFEKILILHLNEEMRY